MIDPYLYPHTDVLKNLADVRNDEKLSCMEAEYTSLRLAELVIQKSASCFDFASLCDMHYYIFQDIYDWAGKIRVINIEKAEPALGGISIEYSDCFDIQRDVTDVLNDMNQYPWEAQPLEIVAKEYSGYLARLWKVHPYREGNTRTIVTFCSQFIESRGFYIESDLFKDNAQYMRTALVAASAIFSDLGDRRKPEYLERIVLDALEQGDMMKSRVIAAIQEAGYEATKENIYEIVSWNRLERYEHNADEVQRYLKAVMQPLERYI